MTEHSSLAAALAAVQAALPTVHKGNRATVPTRSGGSYSYTYADLGDVSAAALPLLSAHGLAWLCKPRRGDGGWELVGTLLHVSGEREEGSLPLAGGSPQEWGSSITYMRRYLLGSMTGLVTDDDDDGAVAQAAVKRPKPSAQSEATEAQLMTDRTRGQLFALLTEHGITDEDDQRERMSRFFARPVASRASITEAEARRLIDKLRSTPRATPVGGEPDGD